MNLVLDEYRKATQELPLLQGPIRFAVVMPDGTTSNSWRVWTRGGDAYVCCRDNMKEIKINLHQSGKQHIAFRQESGIEMAPGSRFWNQWLEPPKQNPAVPSFKLLFPPWGMRLTEIDRQQSKAMRQKWDRNQILIESDEEHLVAVSLIVVDSSSRVIFVGDYPHALIGELPLRPGKKLCVVSGMEPDRGFRSVIEQAIAKIPAYCFDASLVGQDGDDPLFVCLTGDNADGYAFMVVVPLPLPAETN